jgi:hypothetical protein
MKAIGRRALTVLLPVRKGREAALDAVLASVGPGLAERLKGAGSLHFARLVVVPGAAVQGGETGASLLLETTYDGDFDAHVAELFGLAGAELGVALAECDGTATQGGLAEFKALLRRRVRRSRVFAAANGGLAVEVIRHDAALRERIAERLDQGRTELAVQEPLQILRWVRRELGPRFSASARERPPAPHGGEDTLLRGVRAIPLVLRMLIHDAREHLAALWHDRPTLGALTAAGPTSPGSRLPQRAFTHVAMAKPGRFRTRALRHALAFMASLLDEGEVDRVPLSVHAFRFVLLDDGRLLFTDQHDGSLASRLFSLGRRARALLALVWSNTEGHPRALFRHLLGRADDGQLLDWLRAREISSGFSYSAYPTLTARDIRVNAEIRELLLMDPTDARARRLLELV